ncbi:MULTISPECIES: hypothetical protein [unclassified Maridesulfovibrio]|uniref:hypothetical protein n=1 Tax=unclassified Maridesulfovibrio TaxID=2794999 RepID=UPI003B420FAF
MPDDKIQLHFATNIEFPYNINFLSPTLDWASAAATLVGAQKDELNKLRLALEETLAFLIEAYPDAEEWELIKVRFQFTTDGVVHFIIANSGPPIHLDKLAGYNPLNPTDNNLNGLWYLLVREAVDNCQFQSLGKEGWRIDINHQLSAPVFELRKKQKDNVPEGKLAFSCRKAVPDDAPQLMNLVHETYRYSYLDETYYHLDKLRAAIENGKAIPVIVETLNIITGLVTFSRLTNECVSMGAFMGSRAFIHTRSAMTLFRESRKVISENRLGAEIYYCTNVTTHTGSQKASQKAEGGCTALILSCTPTTDYRGMGIKISERETVAMYSWLKAEPKFKTMYLPEQHHQVMRPLLAQIGCEPTFRSEYESLASSDTSFTELQFSPMQGFAMLLLDRTGKDWDSQLRKKFFSWTKIRTVSISIPAWKTLPPCLDEKMAKLNGVFVGCHFLSSSKPYLIYMLLSEQINFDAITLLDPLAVNLKKHIQRLYEELLYLPSLTSEQAC